ncbi:hypothetical protein AVEN_45331-1 [Araneus ventricosus]|uniref:Uncharacterized protein n=1 Tax=Araneus ventricosus TaxID=182803 RepID=A0A4Y2ICM4_ARAVE|nr:hypothetical protein AVEN_45331-1 [Araneus ventricosus]
MRTDLSENWRRCHLTSLPVNEIYVVSSSKVTAIVRNLRTQFPSASISLVLIINETARVLIWDLSSVNMAKGMLSGAANTKLVLEAYSKLALQGGVALVVTANLWQTCLASDGGDSALLVCHKFASSLTRQICHGKNNDTDNNDPEELLDLYIKDLIADELIRMSEQIAVIEANTSDTDPLSSGSNERAFPSARVQVK